MNIAHVQAIGNLELLFLVSMEHISFILKLWSLEVFILHHYSMELLSLRWHPISHCCVAEECDHKTHLLPLKKTLKQNESTQRNQCPSYKYLYDAYKPHKAEYSGSVMESSAPASSSTYL